MYKKLLAVALVGLTLPTLALASPLLVSFGGRTVPMRENVQVTRTPAGTVCVRTWSWRGPGGAVTLKVSESPSEAAPMPAWAVAQMRELQLQMRHMQRVEAALQQSLLAPSPPVPVVLSEPLLVPVPGFGLPLETSLLAPIIVPRALLLPAPVIAIVRPAPHAASSASVRHHGVRI